MFVTPRQPNARALQATLNGRAAPASAAPIGDHPPTYDEAIAHSPAGSSCSSLSSSPSNSGASTRSLSPPRLGPRIARLDNHAPLGTIYPERPQGPLARNDLRLQHGATGTLPHAAMLELNRKLAMLAEEGARMEVELEVAGQTLQRRRELQAAERGHPSAPPLFSIGGGLHVDDDPAPETALKVRRAEKELAKLQKDKDALLKQRDQLVNAHLKRMRKLDGKLQRLTPSPGVSAASSRH